MDFKHGEEIGAFEREVDWEEWELRVMREQFQRVFGPRQVATVNVRPET